MLAEVRCVADMNERVQLNYLLDFFCLKELGLYRICGIIRSIRYFFHGCLCLCNGILQRCHLLRNCQNISDHILRDFQYLL